MKIFQISIEINSGSVGRIAEQIGLEVLDKGWESYITFARNHLPSKSVAIRIGTMNDVYFHVLKTRLFDDHCLASKKATKKLIHKIIEIDPDVIHMHHIHGYFLNMDTLFEYLKKSNKPIVWTFHDCWSFTGHCAYYEFVDCHKWKTECDNCPQLKEYPKTWFFDNSTRNFRLKKELFNLIDKSKMVIVPVSYWLRDQVEKSFLADYHIQVIQNGIDIDLFNIQSSGETYRYYKGLKQNIVLGVASTWDDRKGLRYFVELSKLLSNDFQIILVGLSESQVKKLPDSIIGLTRTESVKELAELYSVASVFVNPTLEDTFPTTNLEALACGTPVVTFRSGGSVESVCEDTGYVVEKGNTKELHDRIIDVINKGKASYTQVCRKKAVDLYDRKNNFEKYTHLYESLINEDVK